MEYLQGRALTNAIGNLDIQGAYADALTRLGHEIEEMAEQERDAALGNGGLGSLTSCFLDSMAPAARQKKLQGVQLGPSSFEVCQARTWSFPLSPCSSSAATH